MARPVGHGWGIYIRESAVLMLAGAVLSEVEDPARRSEPDAIYGAVRASLAILYLHEEFHHRADSRYDYQISTSWPIGQTVAKINEIWP